MFLWLSGTSNNKQNKHMIMDIMRSSMYIGIYTKNLGKLILIFVIFLSLCGFINSKNVNSYGNVKELELPNTKLKISYPINYIRLSDGYKEGFVPDFIINQSFEHYKKGIDDVYEVILNYK